MNNENKTNINWFPGHMAKTRRQITEDLKLIDVVVELLDARIPISSQNPEIAQITNGKKKIIVLNKCDLSDEKENQKWVNYFNKKTNTSSTSRLKYRKRNRKLFKTNRKYNARRLRKTCTKRKNRKKNKSNGFRNTKCRKVIIY